MRYDFGSDNTAGMAPAALEALIAANQGYARAYGADDVTARAARPKDITYPNLPLKEPASAGDNVPRSSAARA